MKKEIYALGIGRGTPIFIELAEACGYVVKGLYHYNNTRTGEIDHGIPVLGSFDDLYNTDIKGNNYMLTMGDMRIKQEISDRLMKWGGVIPTLIHPSSMISRFATVSGNGVLICSQCEIHNDSYIDDGCVMWPRSTVEHESILHKYVFVGPNAYVGASVEIESLAFVGQCSVLISDKARHIGRKALIGAGAIVTKPVSDNTIVAGNPARII